MPPRLLTGKFLLTTWKKEARKKWEKGKMETKRRKFGKGKGRWKLEIETEGVKSSKMRRQPFFLLVTFQND